MHYTPELVEELNILVRYKLDTMQEGIKVHKSTAAPEIVAATECLYRKGLITQQDGGYLTNMGHEAVEMAQTLFNLLNPADIPAR